MKRWFVVSLAALLAASAAEAQFAPGRRPATPRFSGSTTEPAKPPVVFPDLTGKNLAGDEVSFAKDLAGYYTVIFLVSAPEQEIFFETWVPVMRKLADRYENFRYYLVAELPPTAEKSPQPSRWPFAASARRILPEEEHKKIVVPIYTDRRTLHKKLELSEDDTMHIVFVDGKKELVWNDIGVRTSGKSNALEVQIARVASGDR